MLSVIIITRNEAHAIRACLESVAWADEIIVLDSGSEDDTSAICREFTDKIHHTDWPGFGPQKNRALGYAQHEWVLSVDADERVSPALRNELEQAMGNARYTAWQMPRSSSYCGRFMRHGGWWPDYVTRLFKRGSACFSEAVVHETLIIEKGEVGTLTQPLLHESFTSPEEVLDKINAYSSAGAAMRLSSPKRAGLGVAVGHALWTFFKTYIFRLGVLDGREGFMLAVSNAEGVYYRYIKLMYLQESGFGRNLKK